MTGCLRHSHRRGAGLTTLLYSAFPLNLTGGAEGAGLPFVGFKKKMYIYYCSHSSELFGIDDTKLCDLMFSRLHSRVPCLHPLLNQHILALTPRFTREGIHTSSEVYLNFGTWFSHTLNVHQTP